MFSILNVFQGRSLKKIVALVCLITCPFSFPAVGLCEEIVSNQSAEIINNTHFSLILFFILIIFSMSIFAFLLIKVLPSEQSRKQQINGRLNGQSAHILPPRDIRW